MPTTPSVFKMDPNLFKSPNNPATTVIQAVRSAHRQRATELLQTIIPNKITHLQRLIAEASSPESPFWPGHVDSDAYTKLEARLPNKGEEGVVTYDDVVWKFKEGVIELKEDKEEGSGGVGERKGQKEDGEDGGSEDENNDEKRTGGVGGAGGMVYATSTHKMLKSLADEWRSDATDPASQEDVDSAPAQKGEAADKLNSLIPGGFNFTLIKPNLVQRRGSKIILAEAEELNEISCELAEWLRMEEPVEEDGNSFGADVQQALLNEVGHAGKASWNVKSHAISYIDKRTEAAMRCTSRPNMPNYQEWLVLIERADHFSLRSDLRFLLATYVIMLDKFQKNWTKVISPKGEESSSMGMY
ncbi:hypothetical protein IAT38_001031 [Cryptococcus sp. DSM 104549]